MRPEGARVLVTGAGSGIGRAIAIAADARGMTLALCGRRADALAETAGMLTGPALIVAADVTTADGRGAIVEAITLRWGGLDVLVNNAGVVPGGAVAALDDEALDLVLRTNVQAPIALCRDLATLLERGIRPRVVNVGSIFGDIPFPNFAAYSASKFALRGFSHALRREWRARGVGVTYAAPRATRTAAAAQVAGLIGKPASRFDAPEPIARRIVSAIEREQDAVYPRGLERLFVALQRVAPGLMDRVLALRTPVEPQSCRSNEIRLKGSRP